MWNKYKACCCKVTFLNLLVVFMLLHHGSDLGRVRCTQHPVTSVVYTHTLKRDCSVTNTPPPPYIRVYFLAKVSVPLYIHMYIPYSDISEETSSSFPKWLVVWQAGRNVYCSFKYDDGMIFWSGRFFLLRRNHVCPVSGEPRAAPCVCGKLWIQ